MKREVKAPSVGESITEVRIGAWKKAEGEAVKPGDVLLEIESDKANVEVVAEYAGALHIEKRVGEIVAVGSVLGSIEEGAAGMAKHVPAQSSSAQPPAAKAPAASPKASSPAARQSGSAPLSPAVRKAVSESGADVSQISGTGKGGRITKGDLIGQAQVVQPQAQASQPSADGRTRRVPMSMLRRRIAERLLEAQNNAAILTTFNECDMSAVMELRSKAKDEFKTKHGVSLGFMSFFARAVVEALKEVPAVNAQIDGTDIVYHDYVDLGVAVGTDRGLVVPVVRDVGKMSFADIEKGIAALAVRARDAKLTLQELSGGTFTISNGGVYGSLLSTPILNPPQGAILGMHKIQDRPVALDGQIVIKPMMYLALSYDHRLIDGKEAVTFLVKVKEGIENPDALGFTI